MTSNSPTGTLSKGPSPRPPRLPKRRGLVCDLSPKTTVLTFFGRDQEIQELSNRIQHRQLTVLFGQSGLERRHCCKLGSPLY